MTTALADDKIRRCGWCHGDPLYVSYHDEEWGVPVKSDRKLYEKMCLEGFQSGLSWLTILKKRENFRRAFDRFDFEKVARYTPNRIERLLGDAGIVRHRGKIESTINNARQAIRLVERHGSLASYFWRFEPATASPVRDAGEVATQIDESRRLSKELKRDGWSFVGPTTCYALMQAVGMVNDHLRECHAWPRIETLRQGFDRP